jgi:hypothetical protein
VSMKERPLASPPLMPKFPSSVKVVNRSCIDDAEVLAWSAGLVDRPDEEIRRAGELIAVLVDEIRMLRGERHTHFRLSAGPISPRVSPNPGGTGREREREREREGERGGGEERERRRETATEREREERRNRKRRGNRKREKGEERSDAEETCLISLSLTGAEPERGRKIAVAPATEPRGSSLPPNTTAVIVSRER